MKPSQIAHIGGFAFGAIVTLLLLSAGRGGPLNMGGRPALAVS